MTHNEIVKLCYRHTMTKIVRKINECGDFGLVADEGTDSSNTEFLSAAERQCNERFECSECWLGHQDLDNVKSDEVVKGLKVRMLFYVCSLLRTIG